MHEQPNLWSDQARRVAGAYLQEVREIQMDLFRGCKDSTVAEPHSTLPTRVDRVLDNYQISTYVQDGDGQNFYARTRIEVRWPFSSCYPNKKFNKAPKVSVTGNSYTVDAEHLDEYAKRVTATVKAAKRIEDATKAFLDALGDTPEDPAKRDAHEKAWEERRDADNRRDALRRLFLSEKLTKVGVNITALFMSSGEDTVRWADKVTANTKKKLRPLFVFKKCGNVHDVTLTDKGQLYIDQLVADAEAEAS